MSDTTPCAHHQFFGAREFCPDCGLSQSEILVAACEPYLKDGESPAECIARNRRDVDGCLTMLIEERRKADALAARLAEAEREHKLLDEAHILICQAIATGNMGDDTPIQTRYAMRQWLEKFANSTADSAPAVTPFCGPFPEQSEDERTLRYMLAIRCGEPGELYGDDGELQLGGFPYPIDFRRDSVAEIRRKLDARGMAKLAAQLQAADSASEEGEK